VEITGNENVREFPSFFFFSVRPNVFLLGKNKPRTMVARGRDRSSTVAISIRTCKTRRHSRVSHTPPWASGARSASIKSSERGWRRGSARRAGAYLAPSRSLNPAGGCCRRDFVAISPCAARASVGALRQRIRKSGTTTLRGRALRRRSGCVRAGRPARYGILNRRRRRRRASSCSKLAGDARCNRQLRILPPRGRGRSRRGHSELVSYKSSRIL
jgi:hypothetical protein